MKQKSSLLTNDFHENRFESIQALRGIAAIFVVLEHIRFLNCGAFGVDIFFCISGFMIMYTTHKTTAHFFQKRLIRIVPFYSLMTLGTYLLLLLFPSMFEQTKPHFSYLIKSLFFIPFDIGGGIVQPLLRIGWTVNCEMFFYFLFWISFHISHKYRGMICSLLLSLIVFFYYLLAYFFPYSFPYLSSSNWIPLQFYSNPIMLEFSLGIFCYYIAYWLYQHLNIPSSQSYLFKRKRFLSYSCLLFSFCLLLILALSKSSINILGFRRIFYWGIPALLIVLCFFIIGLSFSIPKWLVKLGDISFSIYLIHYYPILFLDRIIFDFSVYNPTAFLGVVFSILLVVLLSYIAWYLIEKQFTKWLYKKFL